MLAFYNILMLTSISSDPSSQQDQRSLSFEEENYFATDDDDGNGEEAENIHVSQPSLSTNSKTSKPWSFFKTYAGVKAAAAADLDGNPSELNREENNDSPNRAALSGEKNSHPISLSSSLLSSTSSPPSAPVLDNTNPTTDPEQELARIREKRKRQENEEEEEDMLTKKKTNTTSSNGKKQGIGGAAPGKFKLLFGAKKS